MHFLKPPNTRVYILLLLTYGVLLCTSCKASHISKSNRINNEAPTYAEVLSRIADLELSDYEKRHLFYERVFFNIDSNSLSFLSSKSTNADSARMQLNKLYSFNKIFNTIYKKDKTKFYPLTQGLDDFYSNELALYDCTKKSFEVNLKCGLIKKVLANQSLNKIETFVGETNITLLSNYSVKTDAKLFFHKNRRVEYAVLKVVRPWFEYGVLSMIYNQSKNKSNQEKKFLINQVILMHQKENKNLILGYVLQPI
ncbi:hypothetical protein TM902_360045 [Tenacibaculum maritimum]|uniref:Uncharacterized protein n=1 Tax=Tenacibaculum maritimum NCIMB 2154 TaxID=1349785 RepID=A0A2H1EBY7_9FLAO|nr:hypothetical protein [Tenacibaculum maritimum]CAA0157958.1 hypothetical protein TM902_360045 [Tenacibaculum maritimum]CAA0253643.1 hypothetical protein JIP32914_80079 [Tenacibaculum maritimum]SFZ83495.1 protein of unknown function [Tenacibaculum maritimum NCIMB 2154]